jgi:hypothetical protein
MNVQLNTQTGFVNVDTSRGFVAEQMALGFILVCPVTHHCCVPVMDESSDQTASSELLHFHVWLPLQCPLHCLLQGAFVVKYGLKETLFWVS